MKSEQTSASVELRQVSLKACGPGRDLQKQNRQCMYVCVCVCVCVCVNDYTLSFYHKVSPSQGTEQFVGVGPVVWGR